MNTESNRYVEKLIGENSINPRLHMLILKTNSLCYEIFVRQGVDALHTVRLSFLLRLFLRLCDLSAVFSRDLFGSRHTPNFGICSRVLGSQGSRDCLKWFQLLIIRAEYLHPFIYIPITIKSDPLVFFSFGVDFVWPSWSFIELL